MGKFYSGFFLFLFLGFIISKLWFFLNFLGIFLVCNIRLLLILKLEDNFVSGNFRWYYFFEEIFEVF